MIPLWITLVLLVSSRTGLGHKVKEIVGRGFFNIALTANGKDLKFVIKGSQTRIQCECTTSDCLKQGVTVCNTTALCFSEYLERRGGPDLIRGCIWSRTPLLCENRRPSRAKNWPLLHCCSTDFCNRGSVPTVPPGREESFPFDATKTNTTNFADEKPANVSSPSTTSADHQTIQEAPTLPQSPSSQTKSTWPHIISPVYVSVLILGIFSLVIIGIVAAAVIRKSNRFYSEQYGALEFHSNFLKVSQAQCDCDSEVDSVRSSQPYLNVRTVDT